MKTNQTPNNPQPRTSRQCSLLTALCAGALLLAGAHASLAQSSTWINTSSETWSNTANWSGGTVADGAGNTADFNTLDLTGQTTVTLDSARTLSTLIFGDTDTNTPAGWLLSNGGNAANTLTVTNITVNPIFAVNTEAATNDALISAVITGTGFVKSGLGTLHLTAANTMTGIRIDAGVVGVGATSALGTGNRTVTYNGGGVRPMTNNTFANTNHVLTTGYIYAPPVNYDLFNGPWTGTGTMFVSGNFRLTVGGGSASTFTNFFGTIDLTNSPNALLLRVNLGSGSLYDFGAIKINTGTNAARIAPRLTVPGTFRIGALTGSGNSQLTSSENSGGVPTIWEIGTLNLSTTFGGRLAQYNNDATRIGALNKVGTGTLTLTHVNSDYRGNTTVTAGKLALSGGAALANTPLISVLTGAVLDVSALTNTWGLRAGQTLGGLGAVVGDVLVTNGTINPGTAAAGTLTFSNKLSLDGTSTTTNLFSLTSPGTGDMIQVVGDLSFANTVVARVVPTGATIPNGTYTLMKWSGTLTGDTNNLALDYPAQPGTLVLQADLGAKELRLVVSGVATAANLVWKGDGAANNWDLATPNWLNGVSASVFVNGDKLTFNDVGSNNVPVNIAATVNPGTLLFNATKSYILSGASGIVGTSTLVKSNTGLLTITTDNAFTGGTLIAGGAVQIGDGAASTGSLGAGNITNNAKLIYNRPDALTTANLIVGSGSVIQSGTAVLTIAGNNTYSGGTVASNGTINLAAYNTLGTGPINMAGGTLIIVPAGGATTGVSNNIITTQDSILQYNAGNSFAAVIFGALSGTPGKTLTINHTPNGGQDRLRLYGSFTNDANLVLNDAAVWLAPYAASGSQVYNGLISGPGSFVNRAGGSTITFNNANTFTGDSRLTTGTYGVGVDSVGSWPSLTSSPLGVGSLVLTNESDSVGGNGGITAIGGARNIGNAVTYSRTNEFTLIVSGSNNLTLSGPILLHGQVDNLGGVDRAFQVSSTGTTTLSGEISDNELDCGLVKTGSGLLWITGTNNSYTGLTTVSAGTLRLDGIVPGNTTVQSGATLVGIGTVGGALTVDAGGTLSPGSGIGTLRASNNITLGGTLYLELNKATTPTSDKLQSIGGTITYGGTLSVKNIGPALQVGDSFQLFPSAVTTFSSIQLSPTDDSGSVYTWENRVAIDGSIKVTAITERIYVATTLNQLISFGNTAPGAILSSVAITGLQPVEAIVGIDFRTNVLYAVGDSSRLYTINRTSGAATAVGGQFSPVLSGTVFGMEVEPGGVRVVTDLGQNLLLDFTTGAATVGTTLNGSLTNVSGLARNPASGQLYVADYLQNKIGTFNPTTGFVTNVGVSGLAGIDFARNNGLDISAVAGNTAYLASPAASSDPAANLYTINLGNGSASLVGLIGNLGDNFLIRGLAVGPAISAAAPGIATNPTNITFSASGGNLTISWPADHIGWSLQAQTNTRAVGLKTNWFTLGGYETTNTAVIPISPANPTVFYRLFYLVP